MDLIYFHIYHDIRGYVLEVLLVLYVVFMLLTKLASNLKHWCHVTFMGSKEKGWEVVIIGLRMEQACCLAQQVINILAL